MPLNILIIGVPILYLPLTLVTRGDALRNTLGGAVPITLGNSILSGVEFSFIVEVGNMEDPFSLAVINTG